ncbi:MAG: MGMT family protein [Planctomycetota bacterium]
MISAPTSVQRFPRPNAMARRIANSIGTSARFLLPTAPAVFRSIVWEAEFSDAKLKRLSLLPDSVSSNESTPQPSLSSQQTARLKAIKSALLSRLKGGRDDVNWDDFDLSSYTGDFHRRVWKAMSQIPFGETATYAEVASNAGSPLAFRACGQACGANPIIVFIPCHRVVSSTGLGGFGCGLEWKKHFLAMEQK